MIISSNRTMLRVIRAVFCFMGFLVFTLTSCSSDNGGTNENGDTPPPQENTPEPQNETLSSEELIFLRELALVDREMGQFWNGFENVRNSPIYIITKENDGIFLNPPASQLTDSRKIDYDLGTDLANFDAFRNDAVHDLTVEALNSNGFIRFFDSVDAEFGRYMAYNLEVELQDNFYNSYKDRNGFFFTSVFYHELLHFYQHERYDEFDGGRSSQNFDDYPLNDRTLPLLMLLFDIMIDAHHVDDIDEKRKILSYYTSIQNELETLDDTPLKLIRRHGFYQEKYEGTARYLEVFSTLNSLNNNTIEDPTHGYADFAASISRPDQLWEVYSFRIFYHTGAGAIKLLKDLGYPNWEEDLFIPENTPFDLAQSFLGLGESALQEALEAAKSEYAWEEKVEMANFLLSL